MDASKAKDNAENSQNFIYYHECSFYYFKNYGSPTIFLSWFQVYFGGFKVDI